METDLDLNMQPLIRKLDGLPDKVQRRVIGKTTNYAATPVVKAARQEVPVDEGTLKDSMGKKTVRYDDTAVTLVGPRISGSAKGYHGHLVHDGHINTDGSFTPGDPYLRRAVEQTQSAASARTAEKLGRELEKEAMR